LIVFAKSEVVASRAPLIKPRAATEGRPYSTFRDVDISLHAGVF